MTANTYITIGEISRRFERVFEVVQTRKELVEYQIEESMRDDSLSDWVVDLAKLRKRLADTELNLKSIEVFLIDVTDEVDSGPDESSKSKSGNRKLIIEVSNGMRKQSLLTLSSARKSGLVRVGEEFVITPSPANTSFKTELVYPGNRLKERGQIRKFYEANKIKCGDSVVLEEKEPGKLVLRQYTKEVFDELASQYL